MNILCTFCHHPAAYRCSRCNIDAYCSEICQKLDYPEHRSLCFSIPPLLPLAEGNRSDPELDAVKEKLGNLKILSGNQNEPPVKVKKVEVNASQEMIVETKKDVPKKVIEKEEIVEPSSEKAEKDTRPTQKEKEPPKVQKKKRQDNVDATLKLPVIKEPAAVPEVKVVPAFDAGVHTIAPQSIPKPLRVPPRMPKPRSDVTHRTLYSSMKYATLETGKRKVLIMHGNLETKIFYVMEVIEGITDYVTWIEDSVNEAVESDTTTSYIPVKNEMVLAKTGGVYYRGLCVEAGEKGFAILFVDYGNLEVCPATDIKPFNASLEMKIHLLEIYITNLVDPLSVKAIELLGCDDGILVNNKGMRKDGTYVCELLGL